jgi:16S rRNA (guanine527-N7)-methyltransferase
MPALDTAVIASLLHPYIELDQPQLSQISLYLDLLLKWNARINLTGIREPREMVTRHFGESFFAAKQLLSEEGRCSVIDLGSGAGFPGLPLALWAPEANVTLIESTGKKAAFLKEAIFSLGLHNVTVFSQRAENYPGLADLVTMRAVESFEKSLALAAGLVKPGGQLALMIGESQVDRARTMAPDMVWNDPLQVPGGHSRVLLVGTKQVKVE